ncbi:hypothetical protein PAMP_019474 [Pampus punctatissimus]
MTSFRFLEFLLFLRLLHQVYSVEAGLEVRAEGSTIEMGYCFGVDYIVVYRCAQEGDQLLGNSSADSAPIILPGNLQGRIHISQVQYLLGLQIRNLTHVDSGIYRRECWQNRTLVSQHTLQLFVCDEEIRESVITVKEEDGKAQLQCNSASIGLEGISVHWYYELYPSNRFTLFLDSSVSLQPLVEELHGAVEVRDSGALLLVNNSVLKDNQHFYCLLIKGMNCLCFQNMYLPVTIPVSNSKDIFASQGDRVLLNCPSDGNNQQWETPLGSVNGSSMENNQMYISFGDNSEHYSLVIPAVSDEHRGKYFCVSSSFELEYSLVLCPRKDPKTTNAFEGGKVSLECDGGQDDDQKVQWYRWETSGEHELIHDSHNENIPVPENLRGRLTLSENGSCLTLFDLKMEDGRMYWCVVFPPDFLENYDDEKDDYDDEEDTTEDDYLYWSDTNGCTFKQEHSVLMKKTGKGRHVGPVTFKPTTTADPSPASNVTAYALGGGLAVLLLLVAVIVTIFAKKKRSKASPKQRDAASQSGLNTNENMNLDPDCIERLTHNADDA